MQPFREPTPSKLPAFNVSLPVAADLTIGLATLPLLTLLAASKAVSSGLSQLGHASEEIFRGEQLPTLPLLQKDVASKK